MSGDGSGSPLISPTEGFMPTPIKIEGLAVVAMYPA